MFVSSEPLIVPVIEYLDSKQIQIQGEKRLTDSAGRCTSVDLWVLTHSGKPRTLNLGIRFLGRRTADQIKEYCESAGIVTQLETSDVGVSIADVL